MPNGYKDGEISKSYSCLSFVLMLCWLWLNLYADVEVAECRARGCLVVSVFDPSFLEQGPLTTFKVGTFVKCWAIGLGKSAFIWQSMSIQECSRSTYFICQLHKIKGKAVIAGNDIFVSQALLNNTIYLNTVEYMTISKPHVEQKKVFIFSLISSSLIIVTRIGLMNNKTMGS